MKKYLESTLVIAAGLCFFFQVENGLAQTQVSPEAGSEQVERQGQPGVPSGVEEASPQGEESGTLGESSLDAMPPEGGRLGGQPAAPATGQEELGVAPQYEGETPEGAAEQQAPSEAESGEQSEQEQFGVAPEAAEETSPRLGTGRSRLGPESEEKARTEQFGVAPRFGGRAAEEPGWVRPDKQSNGGTGWRRKSVPEAGR